MPNIVLLFIIIIIIIRRGGGVTNSISYTRNAVVWGLSVSRGGNVLLGLKKKNLNI